MSDSNDAGDRPRCSPKERLPRIDLIGVFRDVRDRQERERHAKLPPAPQFPPPPPLNMAAEVLERFPWLSNPDLFSYLFALKVADSQANADATFRDHEIVEDPDASWLQKFLAYMSMVERASVVSPRGGGGRRSHSRSDAPRHRGADGATPAAGRSDGKRDVVQDQPGGRKGVPAGIQTSDWSVETTGRTTLIRSKGTVPIESEHIDGIVKRAGSQTVTIYSGVHGGRNGTVTPDKSLFHRDNKLFGGRPNVKVVDVSGMTPDELAAKAKSTTGVVIVNTCNGEAVVR